MYGRLGDPALVAAAQRGDSDSFEELVARHGSMVYRVAAATFRRRRRQVQLLAAVLAHPEAELDQVRVAIEESVLPHARLAAGQPDLPVRVTLDRRAD